MLAIAAFMVSAWAGWVAVPLLGFRVLCCRQSTRTVMLVTREGRFLLPDENQSHLALTAASRSGPGWLQLSFADRPGPGLLLLRDQVDAGAWRVLRLAILESR